MLQSIRFWFDKNRVRLVWDANTGRFAAR